MADVKGIRIPTLEKLLVDIQKDADFDYLRGAESLYMYQMAFDLYTINTQRLMRYAKRRGHQPRNQRTYLSKMISKECGGAAIRYWGFSPLNFRETPSSK